MTKEQLESIRARLEWTENHNAYRAPELGRVGVAPADGRSLLDEVDQLTAERNDLLAWSQRFSDLVGEDGITEASRCDAFAKLYDAAKASGKLVRE